MERGERSSRAVKSARERSRDAGKLVWHGNEKVRALDSQLEGRGFDSRPFPVASELTVATITDLSGLYIDGFSGLVKPWFHVKIKLF